MESQVKEEIISKLAAIGVAPFASRLLSQKWRLQNSIDSESSDVEHRGGPNGEIWLPLQKRPQKLQRRYYTSGQVWTEEIRDADDDHFTDREFFRWHESGSLHSLSLRVSKDERQFVSWNGDGEVLHRAIDRKGEAFDRIVCLTCGVHTLIEGMGQAGFGNSGYMYSDNGRHVFRWDANDPAYRNIVGNETFYPWAISQRQKDDFEHQIKSLPDGSRFRFSNFARCGDCTQTIAPPLPNSSWLVLLDRTIWTDFRPIDPVPAGNKAISLAEWLVSPPQN